MAVAGGFLSRFYGIIQVQAFSALNSAPLILKTLAEWNEDDQVD
jgi:hypothetical protein